MKYSTHLIIFKGGISVSFSPWLRKHHINQLWRHLKPDVVLQDDFSSLSLSLVFLLPRHCWVCFATEGDDRSAEWVCPCRCKGSTKWIHQACLQRWLDEKQKGNSMGSVNCPQCGTEYRIVFPKLGEYRAGCAASLGEVLIEFIYLFGWLIRTNHHWLRSDQSLMFYNLPFAGPLVYFLQQVDRVLSKVSPFAAAGIVVGTLYWSAVTYGAVTVMQVTVCKTGRGSEEHVQRQSFYSDLTQEWLVRVKRFN